MKSGYVFSFILLITLLLGVSSAAGATLNGYDGYDAIFVNSENWQDVYSAGLLGKLVGVETYFLINAEQATYMVENTVDQYSNVLIIQSVDPVIPNLRSLLENSGKTVQIYDGGANINLQIFKDLDVTSAIVVDGAYGYDAISVAPYAGLKESYVLFVDENSVGDYDNEINSKLSTVLIYGFVDSAVVDAIDVSKQRINEGSRFENNIALIEEFRTEKPVNQLMLSNGESIENSIFNGEHPILFIGNSNIPDVTLDYIINSDFKVATLIGHDLANQAKALKDVLDGRGKTLTIIMMIGKAATGNAANKIQVLDMYPIPSYDAKINIANVRYNQITKKVEVTIENENDLRVFFLTTITVTIDGQNITLGDDSTQFLEGGKSKVLVYDADLEGSADIYAYTIYGDSAKALERRVEYDLASLSFVEVVDNAEISIEGVQYDRFNKAFVVLVKNIGDSSAYADVELINVIVDGEETILAAPKPKLAPRGETVKVYVRAKLSSLDIEENSEVLVKAYYGEKKAALFKTIEETLVLEMTIPPTVLYGGAAAAVALVIIILLLMRRKPSKKD